MEPPKRVPFTKTSFIFNRVGEEPDGAGGLIPSNISTTDGSLSLKNFLYLSPMNA